MEGVQPQYILKPVLRRLFIPQFLGSIAIFVAFYFALWLNLTLMEIELTTNINILAVSILFALFAVEMISKYMHAKADKYMFYLDKVVFEGRKTKEMYFVNVRNISFKQDILDKIFNTGTITLLPDFNIKSVPHSNQIYFYIQKLIQSSRGYQQSKQ